MIAFAAFIIISILKLWVFIYEWVSYPFFILFNKKATMEKTIYAMPIKEGDPASPWRDIRAMDGLKTTPVPGCETLVDLWNRATKLWPNRDALGTREVLSSHIETQPDGKQFKKLIMGEYFWETYAEVDERVTNVAKAMLNLGLVPGRDRIVIFAETRAEWMIVAQASFKVNISIVTLYSTLGEEAIMHGINESEAATVFTSDELIGKIAPVVSKCPAVKNVIFMDNKIFHEKNCGEMENLKNKIKPKLPNNVNLMELSKLELLGNEDDDDILNNISCKTTKDSVAVIMYTSGSTGVPKGVEMTQANVLAALAGILNVLPKFSPETDSYISYLPLAHVMEMVCEFVILTQGIKLGYSSPLTLTDTSSKIKSKTKGDISVLKPTLMVCVPTILERVNKAVWAEVNDQGYFFSELFKWACAYKKCRQGRGYPSVFMDKIVFRRIKKLLGGKLRYMLSGGAPLSEEAQNFVNICLNPIVQGYGLTETCAAGSIMKFKDFRTGHGGPPITCLQIQLRDWIEGGYSPMDKPNPRGEILIGGPNVAKGYFKQPEKTKESFFTDDKGIRWFCTGDIGMFHPDGTLSIIDRKKDLVKLQGGEYVSLGKVELALSKSPMVESACVYADSSETYTVCFISPKKKQLIQLAEKYGITVTSDNLEDLTKDRAIIKAVTEEIKKVCVEKNVQRFEIPQKVHLDHKSWTPDSGLVTDALKLKRREIKHHFQDVIDEFYGRSKTRSVSSVGDK